MLCHPVMLKKQRKLTNNLNRNKPKPTKNLNFQKLQLQCEKKREQLQAHHTLNNVKQITTNCSGDYIIIHLQYCEYTSKNICSRSLIGKYLPLFLHWVLICKPSCLNSCISGSSFWSCSQNFTQKLLALTLTKKKHKWEKEGIRLQRYSSRTTHFIAQGQTKFTVCCHYWLTDSLYYTLPIKEHDIIPNSKTEMGRIVLHQIWQKQ